MIEYESKFPLRAGVYVKPTSRLTTEQHDLPTDEELQEMVAAITEDELDEDADEIVEDRRPGITQMAELEGTWEVVPNKDVTNDTVVVSVHTESLAAGQYITNKGLTFAITKRGDRIWLIPNAPRRVKRQTTYVLTQASTSNELAWQQICQDGGGLMVTWRRTSIAQTGRITRGGLNAQVRQLTNLTAKRKRQPMEGMHRCCCGHPKCRPMSELNNCQSVVPRAVRRGKGDVRRPKREYNQLKTKRTILFRAQFNIHDAFNRNRRVNAQHWPRRFFEKYGNKGRKQLPKLLPKAEATELGMYVEGNPCCAPLLSADGETVVCIPWLTWKQGRHQYSRECVDSSPVRKVARTTPYTLQQHDPSVKKAMRDIMETVKANINKAQVVNAIAVSSIQAATVKANLAQRKIKTQEEEAEQRKRDHLKEIKKLENELRLALDSGQQFTSEEFLCKSQQCQRFFGFKTRTELIAWTTKVFFPFLKYEPMKYSKARSYYQRVPDFQKACLARMYMKTGLSISMLGSLWSIPRRSCGKILAKWCPMWAHVSKYFCRLTFDGDYLKRCQLPGNEARYGLPISHLNDGTVCQTETPRANTTMHRCMYNSKIYHAGTLALAHSAPTGLCLFATDTFAGNAQELDLVRIYRDWWDAYPPGFARLVDKGFAWHTNLYYKYGNKGLYPAFLTRGSKQRSAAGTKQLSEAESRDATKQSQHRYVVETFFSRVKNFEQLKGEVKWDAIKYINDTYLTACAAANLLLPLQEPVGWQSLKQDFTNAMKLTREIILDNE